MPTRHTSDIRDFLIQQIYQGHLDIVRRAQEQFDISRQAVNRLLRGLIAEGVVTASGQTRNRAYTLVSIQSARFETPLSASLHEDEIWRDKVRSLLNGVPSNILEICQFGLTEMLNNAIDHSEGKALTVSVSRTAAAIQLEVMDDGVGIFLKIKRDLNLADARYALLELSKGKLTTEPAHHSGQGIFFTSRAFDRFIIHANGMRFEHNTPDRDWLMGDEPTTEPGTQVVMSIGLQTRRTLPEVFERFASSEAGYGFDRTIVPVKLAQYGDENLVSRSQAKRLLTRFDRFKEVLLDFKDVAFIGQAFADEVFRVYRNEYPEVNLTYINAAPVVESMILGARASAPDRSA